MLEEEYKKEWINGLHQTDYNACRFAEDKEEYCKQWLLKRKPNLNIDNPVTLQDRIAWCKVYDKDKRKPFFADKLEVQYELVSLGLKELCMPIIAKYKKLTTRDLYDLPNGKYIIKCNHASGWNIRFTANKNNDYTYIVKQVNEWLDLNYAYIAGWEWQYDKIDRYCIIEKDYGELMDWSFWCENGKIEYIGLTKKISKNIERYIAFMNADCTKPDITIGLEPELKTIPNSFKIIIQKMKSYVKQLAKDFKFVRVDMYYINNEIKLGELTFTPCSGIID